MSSKPAEKRQVVRFAFFSLDTAWRRLSAERQASSKIEFGPFIETRAWYMLPKAERQTMMDEHVRVGRKYPSIRLNTTYSYGLDDQEFIVAFEGDNPADFLDLVMELRESQASSYTLRDTPTFTCVQMSLWDMLDTLGGAGSAQALSRRPARADGYTPVAALADLPAGAG